MNIVNEIITRLRRDDTLLEPLRRQVEQQEKEMDWETLHRGIVYVLVIAALVGFAFVGTVLWISL